MERFRNQGLVNRASYSIRGIRVYTTRTRGACTYRARGMYYVGEKNIEIRRTRVVERYGERKMKKGGIKKRKEKKRGEEKKENPLKQPTGKREESPWF
ncbi:hypothetical protein ACLOJK_031765 [Asimina triloba]